MCRDHPSLPYLRNVSRCPGAKSGVVERKLNAVLRWTALADVMINTVDATRHQREKPSTVSSTSTTPDSLLLFRRPFGQRVDPVSRELPPLLFASVRPAHIDAIDNRRPREAELHAEIVL